MINVKQPTSASFLVKFRVPVGMSHIRVLIAVLARFFSCCNEEIIVRVIGYFENLCYYHHFEVRDNGFYSQNYNKQISIIGVCDCI